MALAQVTPASITYKVNEVEQKIRFHSVIMEGHEASSEITKFPVQSGFLVSNHAIRKNRKVTIEALFTNYILKDSAISVDGTNEQNNFDLNDGKNNSKAAFAACKALVNSATPCKVVTNLGIYNDVIFTSFRTKTEAGMSDCIKVVLVGEEVQTQFRDNRTAPILVKFVDVPTAKRDSVIAALAVDGIAVPEGAPLSQSFVDISKSFAIATATTLGVAVTNTYETLSVDGVSSVTNLSVSEGFDGFGNAIYKAGETATFSIVDLAKGRLDGALGAASACIVDGVIDAAIEEGEEFVDTASGVLRKGLYGTLSKITGVNAGEEGALLPGLAKECVAIGAKAIVTGDGLVPLGGLPDADTVAAGFRRQSSGLTADKYLFTKIGDALSKGASQ